MGKKEIKKEVLRISEGVLSTFIDMLLVYYYLLDEFPGGKYGIKKAGYWASWRIQSHNYETMIKPALYSMKQKGLINYVKDKILEPQITAQGLKKLRELIPSYDEKRIWNGKIYLITYDIPEEKARDRDILREYLKRIGCGRLQNSVWITPFNPQNVLKIFVEERNLSGSVIVSCIGKDGNVGQEDIKDLINRVFGLDDLNMRYIDFLKEFSKEKKVDKTKLVFSFLSILQDDPRLPFELLPELWFGEEAYRLYRRFVKKGLI